MNIESHWPSQREPWTDLRELIAMLSVLCWQITVIAIIRATGFSGISDDDAARVAIAMEFAQHPSLDPSGTSWLPVPFWFTGAFLKIFGATLGVAKAAATLGALGSCLLLYFSARMLGATRRLAAGAAIVCASLPLSAHLASSTVPEYPTAAGIVLGASILSARRKRFSPEAITRLRLVGAAAFFLCAGSRYEAWAPALVYAGFQFKDAFSVKDHPHLRDAHHRHERGVSLASALIAASFPVLWLLHGVLHHGDALFFVKRVVDYKHALDGSGSLLDAFLSYPTALVLTEPEVTIAFLLGGIVIWGKSIASVRIPSRAGYAMLALVASLMLGAVRGGAPTHHPERALLSFWLFLAVVLSAALSQMGPLVRQRRLLLHLGAGVLIGGVIRASSLTFTVPYVDREHEEEVGRFIAEHLSAHEIVALGLNDYGYFSVIVSAGHPERFVVLERHDPRDSKPEATLQEKLARFQESGGCHWVVPATEMSPAAAEIFRSDSLVLQKSHICGP